MDDSVTSVTHSTPIGEDWCVQAQLTIREPSGSDVSLSSSTFPPTRKQVSLEYSWQRNRVESFTRTTPIERDVQKFDSFRIPSNESGCNTAEIPTGQPLIRTTCSIQLLHPIQVTREIPGKGDSAVFDTTDGVVPKETSGVWHHRQSSNDSQKIRHRIEPSTSQDAQTQTSPKERSQSDTARKNSASSRHSRKDNPTVTLRSHRAKSSPPERLQQKPNQQPRTIHIDVYCTGSEGTTTNDDDSGSEFRSSPNTVYENPNYKILHHHKRRHQIPKHLNEKSETGHSDSEAFDKRRGSKLSFAKMEFLSNLIKSGLGRCGILEEVKGFDSELPTRSPSMLSTSDWRSETSGADYSSTVGGIGSISRNVTQDSIASSISTDNLKCLTFEIQNQPCEQRPKTIGQGRNEEVTKDVRQMSSISETPVLPVQLSGKIEPKINLKPKCGLIRSRHRFFSIGAETSSTLNRTISDLAEEVIPPFTEIENQDVDIHLGSVQKFGSMVPRFRKPGHHIPGPPKNPSCPCHHCRHFFEEQEIANQKKESQNPLLLDSVRRRAFSLESKYQHGNNDKFESDGRS